VPKVKDASMDQEEIETKRIEDKLQNLKLQKQNIDLSKEESLEQT